MTQRTLLAKQIDSADSAARLDNACKKLLANKIILAWIMKSTVKEFSSYTAEEIADKCIDNAPKISDMPVHRDETLCITNGSSEALQNYDLITVIMVCLKSPMTVNQNDNTVIFLLSILLSPEITVTDKKRILENKFGIPMTEQLNKEVTEMCNYSQGVKALGISQGIQEGIFMTLSALVRDGLLKTDEAARRMNVSEETFKIMMTSKSNE